MPTPAFPRSLFAIAPFRVPDLGSFCFVQVLCSQLPNAKKWVRFVIFAEAPHATTTASGSGSFRHIGHRRPAPVHLPPSSAGGWVPVLYNELVRQGQTQGDLAPARFHFYDHQNSSTPTRKHASPATAAVDRQRQIGFVSHRCPNAPAPSSPNWVRSFTFVNRASCGPSATKPPRRPRLGSFQSLQFPCSQWLNVRIGFASSCSQAQIHAAPPSPNWVRSVKIVPHSGVARAPPPAPMNPTTSPKSHFSSKTVDFYDKKVL